MTFGAKLREARVGRGWSRVDAAAKLRCKPGALQWWEEDRCLPRDKALRTICRVFGFDHEAMARECMNARIMRATNRIVEAA